MAAKSKASESKGRGREIAGIALLGFGIFSLLSLASMHAGVSRLMGPGGAATASGLYGLAGFGAYLLVIGTLITATRCFRGRPLHGGLVEMLGLMGVFASFTVLLHLPFAERRGALRGPGGLLGQWLGEITASFIGVVGAALAAVTLFSICLLLVTSIELDQVLRVAGYMGARLADATSASARALGRLVLAMFPEKDDSDRAAAEREADELEALYDEDLRVRRAASEEIVDDDDVVDERPSVNAPAERTQTIDKTLLGVGAPAGHDDQDDEDEDRIGDEPTMMAAPVRDEQREAVAALVAEVAAADLAATRPAPEDESTDDDAVPVAAVLARPPVHGPVTPAVPVVVAATPPRPPGAKGTELAPIIVEPAHRARERAEAEGAAAEPKKKDDRGFIKLSAGEFVLPSTTMLEYIPPKGDTMDRDALYDMAGRLEQAMANYGVRGKVKEIHMGPVVTMFEFAPAPGTRTGKIANLENDLAMALEAQAVRIVAPIPGKAVVGVEVPNKRRETVYLKEILEDDCFTKSGSKLQMSLGKDIKGTPVTVNLSKMPHLLVAGTTGSGKSVAVNGMITSILYNATPEEVRFIMVDPKMLELSIYEGIPHLLLPVVTDPNKANLALRWAVEEMERRYELLAKTGVRDLASYNARIDALAKGKLTPLPAPAAKRLKVLVAGADGVEREVEVEDPASASAEGPVPADELAEQISAEAAALQAAKDKPAEEPLRKLPFIVIVIDEFADLMMVAPKDVETSVARIAQKARAAGLHLILATQRPSVDVITGLIKANFPSRIALQVASKIDSRTILDQSGAETLLGNGDMLFSDRGTKLRRIHGAFLSDDEVHRVVDFLKKQAKPVYDMEILKPRDDEAEGGGAPVDDFHDELYDQAVAIVCDTRQASVSFIQRRLQIGYNRAARMVEHMEREGIVGPANGMKPREILAPGGEYLSHAP